jgi:hypothetical protein
MNNCINTNNKMSSTQIQQKPPLDYKNACLKKGAEPIKQSVKPVEKIDNSFTESCKKAVNTLYTRWEKYRLDYIEIYGQDTYEAMYVTPNYWVMPEEDDEEEEEEQTSDYCSDDNYYYSD